MNKKYGLFALIVVIAVVSDYVTKSVAEKTLASQTHEWTHSIYRTVTEDESGLTVKQWADRRFSVDEDEPKEAYVYQSIYLNEKNNPNIAPRRLPADTLVRGGDTLEIRYRVVNIIDGFWRHTYARNPGAAFGFLADAPKSFSRPFFLVVSVIALLIIISLLRSVPRGDKALTIALGCITGGAIGNLIDRVMYGYVIDFIEWYITIDGSEKIWPTFNVADSFITVGVTLMLLLLVFGDLEFLEEEQSEEPQESEESPA